MAKHKRQPIRIVNGMALEGSGRLYKLHPTASCPRCGKPLMLGNPSRNEWHCIDPDGEDFIAHYEASQRFEPLMDAEAQSGEQGKRPTWPDDMEWGQPLWDIDGQPTNKEALYIEDMELYAQDLESHLARLPQLERDLVAAQIELAAAHRDYGQLVRERTIDVTLALHQVKALQDALAETSLGLAAAGLAREAFTTGFHLLDDGYRVECPYCRQRRPTEKKAGQ